MQRGLSGETVRFARNAHEGADILESIRPFSALGLSWLLVADIPVAEAMTPVTRLRTKLLWVVGVFGVAAALLGAVFSRVLTRPILLLQARVSGLRQGDLETAMPSRGRRDEIGHLAVDLEQLREQLARARDQEYQAAEHARAVRQQELEAQEEARDQKRVVELLSQTITQLEQGDLTARIKADFPAKYDILRSGLNAAIARLCDAVNSIADSAGTIDGSARGIETSIEGVRGEAESQAADLADTAAAITQLTQSVADAAENTLRAEKGMQATIGEVHRNEGTVSEARRIMEEISSSADQDSVGDHNDRFRGVPDQPPGSECQCRGRTRGRGRQGLWCRGCRGARSCGTHHSRLRATSKEQLDGNARVIGAGTEAVARLAEFFASMITELNDASTSIAAISCCRAGTVREYPANRQRCFTYRFQDARQCRPGD